MTTWPRPTSPSRCRLFDYCLINDGGVALIIAEAELAKKLSPRPVFIEGVGRYDLNEGATSLEPRLTGFYRPAQQAAAARCLAWPAWSPRTSTSSKIL